MVGGVAGQVMGGYELSVATEESVGSVEVSCEASTTGPPIGAPHLPVSHWPVALQRNVPKLHASVRELPVSDTSHEPLVPFRVPLREAVDPVIGPVSLVPLPHETPSLQLACVTVQLDSSHEPAIDHSPL